MSENFDQWCVIEMLGHRRLAGHVTEAQISGASFLRVDIPGEPQVTQYIAPGSVYAIHPTTEEIVRSVAARFRPAPVQRWELAPVVEASAEPYEDASYEGGAF